MEVTSGTKTREEARWLTSSGQGKGKGRVQQRRLRTKKNQIRRPPLLGPLLGSRAMLPPAQTAEPLLRLPFSAPPQNRLTAGLDMHRPSDRSRHAGRAPRRARVRRLGRLLAATPSIYTWNLSTPPSPTPEPGLLILPASMARRQQGGYSDPTMPSPGFQIPCPPPPSRSSCLGFSAC